MQIISWKRGCEGKAKGGLMVLSGNKIGEALRRGHDLF
jgi:hypothetical protein